MTQNATKLLKYLLFIGIVLQYACGSTQQFSSQQKKELQRQLTESPVLAKSFTGFALYDPSTKEMLYEQDANKYYTPASNTKIFTLYTALKILGDELPLLQYYTHEDSLVFWGTGNPLLLHPDFEQNNKVVNFLKNRPEQLYFSDHNFSERRFGPGWAWDDYRYGYQAEKSPMPIYGNTARFKRDSAANKLDIMPDFFAARFVYQPEFYEETPYIKRQEFGNIFEYNQLAITGASYDRYIPFDYSPEFLATLLTDTLGKYVVYARQTAVSNQKVQTLSVPMPDTLYQQLMKDSDNFIAEQLLLMCSNKVFGEQNSEKMIDYAVDSLLSSLPDEPQWWDGSGLTRYNLFTPRSIVRLLELIRMEIPEERIFSIFPAGGASGTIQNWYAGEEGPYVFAKTGTLRNKHCLSGYLKCKSGKTLIFSFMHNNYITASAPLKKEMNKILSWLRDNY